MSTIHAKSRKKLWVIGISAGIAFSLAGFIFSTSQANPADWNSPVVVDSSTTNSLGRYSSLMFVDGNPAISYYDETGTQLIYIRAKNSTGTQWGNPVVIADSTKVGSKTSMVVVDGNPAIAYYDSTNDMLMYTRAEDQSGTTWSEPVEVDPDWLRGQYVSMAVVNGVPAMSYYDTLAGDLLYVYAKDASGTAWNDPVEVDNGYTAAGIDSSLAVVNGAPAISYYDSENGELMYVRANDASGSEWGSPISLDISGIYTSLAVVDGYPAVGYLENMAGDLKFVRAMDANGSAWSDPITLDDDDGGDGRVGAGASMAILDGLPLITYYDETNQDLKLIQATDSAGTSWGEPVRLDSTGNVGVEPSLMVSSDGSAGISYMDSTNGDLKYIHFLAPNDGKTIYVPLIVN